MVVKANLSTGMFAAVLLGGLCVLEQAKPYERTVAQESSSASQSSWVMGQIASEQDIDLMRHDLRDKKQEIIARNLSLSEAEAEKFWPIYEHYANDLKQINDEKYDLLRNYAQSSRDISNHDALIYIRRSLEIDQEAQALRSKYVPVVSQVLTGKGTATFFQLDRRIGMMMDIQLASQIPLLQGKQSSAFLQAR
jgi:hypothetical protein